MVAAPLAVVVLPLPRRMRHKLVPVADPRPLSRLRFAGPYGGLARLAPPRFRLLLPLRRLLLFLLAPLLTDGVMGRSLRPTGVLLLV